MKKLLSLFALVALVGSCFAQPFRIVAYGDSITYGWVPNPNPPSTRYGPEERWQGPVFGEMFKGGLEKSKQLPELYEAVAKMGGAEFLNAGSVASTDGVDGLHLTAESQKKLGVAVAQKVKEILK
jgi:lysophospholipase L1-like esterase